MDSLVESKSYHRSSPVTATGRPCTLGVVGSALDRSLSCCIQLANVPNFRHNTRTMP